MRDQNSKIAKRYKRHWKLKQTHKANRAKQQRI